MRSTWIRPANIPMDWDGAMGVPITFLDKHSPEQFEIMGITDRDDRYSLKTKRIHVRQMRPTITNLNGEGGVIRVGSVNYRRTYSSHSG